MIRFVAFVLAVASALSSGAASAQMHGSYTGLQDRPIKALSERQVADLRAGRGMGLALAAELNGYPGPVHVLEHADALGLDPARRARMTALYDAMKAEAIPLGERLIAQEAELDRRFRDRSVTSEFLVAATEAIGATQAALRATHLRYHLVTVDLLTPDQMRRYDELRGYADATEDDRHDGTRHTGSD